MDRSVGAHDEVYWGSPWLGESGEVEMARQGTSHGEDEQDADRPSEAECRNTGVEERQAGVDAETEM